MGYCYNDNYSLLKLPFEDVGDFSVNVWIRYHSTSQSHTFLSASNLFTMAIIDSTIDNLRATSVYGVADTTNNTAAYTYVSNWIKAGLTVQYSAGSFSLFKNLGKVHQRTGLTFLK